MKRFTSKTQKIGELGETIALSFFLKKGFVLEERNYTQRFGEIDLILRKDESLHFVEVKSSLLYKKNHHNVSYETYNPAENLTRQKIKKLQKTLLYYLEERKFSHETRWQLDLCLVYIDPDKSHHSIELLENII